MKIIYNESAAILEKQQKDIEIPRQNRRAMAKDTIVVVFTAAAIVALWAVAQSMMHTMEPILCFVGWIILSLLCVGVASAFWTEVVPNYMRYSANCQYYIEKGDKKVIDHSLKYIRDGNYILWLTLEDENHIVSQECLGIGALLKSQTQTDITETTVDLEAGIVYMPYKT